MSRGFHLFSAVIFCSFAFVSCYSGDDDCCDDPLTVYGGSALSPLRYVLSGSNGSIIYTADGGQNYSRVPTGVSTGLRDIKINASYGLSVGRNGTLLRSTVDNYGIDWKKLDLGVSYDLNKVTFGGSDLNYSYIAADDGYILKSSDQGESFAIQRIGIDFTKVKDNYGIGCADKDLCWAVGELGSIYKTENGGSSWTEQSSGTTSNLRDIFVLNRNTAWAVGDMGALSYTINGGLNWELHHTGFTNDFSRVYFKDSLNGLIVGDNFVGRTTDAGESIDAIQDSIQAVRRQWRAMLNYNDFALLGGKDCGEPYVGYTNDFGVNWQVVQLPADVFGVRPIETPTPSSTEAPTPTVPAGGTPIVAPTATSPGSVQPTVEPTATQVPSGPTGCAALLGSYVGDGGCQIGGVVISTGSGTITLDPFGTNGAQTFNVSGASASSQSSTLSLFGQTPHTCSLSCDFEGANFSLHCERVGNSSINCDEEFS